MSDEFQSKYCRDEVCGACGEAAAYHKIEEVVFDDDPNPGRHPFTRYLCNDCFFDAMGPAAKEFNFATGGLPKPADQYDKKGDEIKVVLEPLVREFLETFDPDFVDDLDDFLDIEFWIMEWFSQLPRPSRGRGLHFAGLRPAGTIGWLTAACPSSRKRRDGEFQMSSTPLSTVSLKESALRALTSAIKVLRPPGLRWTTCYLVKDQHEHYTTEGGGNSSPPCRVLTHPLEDGVSLPQ